MSSLGRILHSSRQVYQAVSPYKRKISILLGISLLEAISASFGILLIIPFLDIATGKQSLPILNTLLTPILALSSQQHQISLLAGFMLLAMALKCALSLFNTYLATSFTLKLSEQWSNRLHQLYLRRRFDLSVKDKHGEVLHNLAIEPPTASKFLMAVVEYCSRIVLSIAMVVVLITIDWQITLGLGSIAAAIWFCLTRATHTYTSALGRKRIEAQQAVLTQASENIAGQTVIKAFSLTNWLQQHFETVNAYKRRVAVRFRMTKAIPAPAGEFIVFSTVIAIIFAITGFDPQRIQAKLPVVTALVICSQQLTKNLSFLITHAMDITFRLPSIVTIHQALDQHAFQEEFTGPDRFDRLQSDIVLNNVSFFYDENAPVFKDLTLTFPRGKMSAIIGPSGVGKSTVMHLLMGLLKPTAGHILVNDKPLTDYQMDSWRSRIGYVGQDPFLFHGTIRDNIRMGRVDATDHDIEQAARVAAIHDFIVTQPNGYDTVVGDRGVTISGGQKQRISIARAIVRDPDLYLFDEATSALDHESERLVQHAMQQLSESKKTVIVVAHRLTTIENADVVYNLKDLQHDPIRILPSSLTAAHH